MESPALPWKPFHESVGLCLRFNYIMPLKSRSYLKVLLREPKQGNPLLIWQLAGNHGEQWSAAQVALTGVENVQVSERTKITHARYIKYSEAFGSKL